MGEKDSCAKRYFSVNDRFADVFNYKVYGGKEVIKAEDLREVSVEAFPINRKLPNKYRDILKAVVVRDCPKNDQTYILLGIEAQTSVDYTMVVRCMEYDVMRIRQEIRQRTQLPLQE